MSLHRAQWEEFKYIHKYVLICYYRQDIYLCPKHKKVNFGNQGLKSDLLIHSIQTRVFYVGICSVCMQIQTMRLQHMIAARHVRLHKNPKKWKIMVSSYFHFFFWQCDWDTPLRWYIHTTIWQDSCMITITWGILLCTNVSKAFSTTP